MPRPNFTPHEIQVAKNEARALVKPGQNIEDLSDAALLVISFLAESELVKRNSDLAKRGRSRFPREFDG